MMIEISALDKSGFRLEESIYHRTTNIKQTRGPGSLKLCLTLPYRYDQAGNGNCYIDTRRPK